MFNPYSVPTEWPSCVEDRPEDMNDVPSHGSVRRDKPVDLDECPDRDEEFDLGRLYLMGQLRAIRLG